MPVPENDLPVLLPAIEDFRPDDTGISPLARHEEWYYVPCPECGKRGRRETDVSDTFLDSAWYYLRYPSTEFDDRPFDPARTRTWLPVTTYIGGQRARGAAPALLPVHRDGAARPRLSSTSRSRSGSSGRTGMIVKDGAKMSKSRGNVVVPDEYIAKWGADTFRMYLMFLGPFQEGGDFRDEGISGPRRFLDKVWALVERLPSRDDAPAASTPHAVAGEAAPDQEEGHRGHRGAALQHRDRRADGAGEHAAGRELLRPRGRSRSWS